MYKKYEFNIDHKSVLVIGDTHGNWGVLKYKIRESGITNAVIIIAGDCGIGFEKEEYYKQEYNKMVKVLKSNNVTIIFVRGNHDDTSYFDGEKIDFEYWKAVPDYSVLSFNDSHNILCIGGAISVDRWDRRKDQSKYTNGKKLYWENEIPVYNPEVLDKINEDGIKINTMINHSSPSFAPLNDQYGIQSYIQKDNALIEDIANERLVMTQIYDHLVKKDKHPLKLIIHGHFHRHSIFHSDDEVKIVMLDCVNVRHNTWDIYPIER